MTERRNIIAGCALIPALAFAGHVMDAGRAARHATPSKAVAAAHAARVASLEAQSPQSPPMRSAVQKAGDTYDGWEEEDE